MDLLSAFSPLLLLSLLPSGDTSLITGQRVCRVGRGKPCYKLAYFSEPQRRLSFEEAGLACRRDGGELLSVESASEQRIIEQLITELRPSDGDFWIGLRRNHGDQNSSEDCPALYYWLDGSTASFRNWHWDEPSCGYEVCVVMYHQPSAPPSVGGVYMFQWNDDNCETKNNFICKYTTEKPPDPAPSELSTHTFSETPPTSLFPWSPTDPEGERRGSTSLNVFYIILPTIPLLLLFLTATGVCCFKLLARRKNKHKQQPEVCQSDPGLCASPTSAEVYKVIRSQKEADLTGTRPHTKNTSFLGSSPDTPPGDYDNLGGRDTESGFVTLASTESCFLNYELNDLSLGRRGNRDPYDTSLGRHGTRDPSYDTSLGRYGNRESYDRSLGRCAGRTALYGSGCYGDGELYDAGLGGKSEFYDGGPGFRGQGAKAELYQTYLVNGRDDVYQTSLCRYGSSRKPYEMSVDCYGNEPSLSSGKRYFREAEWVDSDSY